MSLANEVAERVRKDLVRRGIAIEPEDCLSITEEVLSKFGDYEPDWETLLDQVDDVISMLPHANGDGKPASKAEVVASIEALLGDFSTEYDVDAIFREAYDYHSGGLLYHVGKFEHRIARRDPGYFLEVGDGLFDVIIQNNERKCD